MGLLRGNIIVNVQFTGDISVAYALPILSQCPIYPNLCFFRASGVGL